MWSTCRRTWRGARAPRTCARLTYLLRRIMRVLFLGNNWLGWQALQWLRQQDDEIVGVAIHPESRCLFGNEIRAEVEKGNCPLVDGSRLKEAAILEQVQNLNADIAVSVLF